MGGLVRSMLLYGSSCPRVCFLFGKRRWNLNGAFYVYGLTKKLVLLYLISCGFIIDTAVFCNCGNNCKQKCQQYFLSLNHFFFSLPYST